MTCKPQKQTISRLDQIHRDRFFDLLPVASGLLQGDTILMVNKSCARLLGFSDPGQVSGLQLSSLLDNDSCAPVAEFLKGMDDTADNAGPVETKIISQDRTEKYVEISAVSFPLDHGTAVQFALHEISRRKIAEEMLFQSKQDWEETFNAITDMITVHDRDFNVIYANRAAEESLGIPISMTGNGGKCFAYYHGTECPPAGCPSCDCLVTGKSANFEIYEPHLKMYIEIRSMPRFDSNNQLIGLIHIARDVTERKRSQQALEQARNDLEERVSERTSELQVINDRLTHEIDDRRTAVEALKKSEDKYRTLSQQFNALLDGIPDNLLLISPDLQILWANNSASSLFSARSDTLCGQYCYSLCCSITSPCDLCPVLKSFDSGMEEAAEITTAEERIWDIRSFPIRDESGKVSSVIELARDITEKANLEAGATRTRHLASLGELAAGVAHEINNPINNIINYGQILLDEFAGEGRDDEIAARIIKDGDRIATIVRSLLSFARIRKEEKCLLSLHEIFSDTMSLTAAQLKKDGIHLVVDVPSDPFMVLVHPQQIQQVMLNIISNARFALNQKYPGTHDNKILMITCDEISIGDSDFVRIIFHDNGEGIPEKIIDKVMNPFFSTKPNRIGTGLGLSISHGIITEHGGKLLINSLEGEYTTISIQLPVNRKNKQ